MLRGTAKRKEKERKGKKEEKDVSVGGSWRKLGLSGDNGTSYYCLK